MPYIAREDGENFVIPSYRDVLSAKNTSALKKQILQLSESYGEYITLQPKGKVQYEVAFSPDPGYLLGETVWHHFNKPDDMIYCEAIPGTSEAILVVVKSGSVYLDGSFATDSIPDELVIFLTQDNNFDIYISGNVPISESPEEGKFSFDESSVSSFTVLEEPVFEKLPLINTYHLELVEQAIKARGIGTLPVKQIVLVIAVIVLGWMMWSMLKPEPPPQREVVENPYQSYLDILQSPAPDQEMMAVIKRYKDFYTMPGWDIKKLTYNNGNMTLSVETMGSKVARLENWASKNNANLKIMQKGIQLTARVNVDRRAKPKKIYKLQDVIAELVDRVASVYPGNHIKLNRFQSRVVYQETEIQINIEDASPLLLSLIAEQLKGLPLVLQSVKLDVEKNGAVKGSINLKALGD